MKTHIGALADRLRQSIFTRDVVRLSPWFAGIVLGGLVVSSALLLDRIDLGSGYRDAPRQLASCYLLRLEAALSDSSASISFSNLDAA